MLKIIRLESQIKKLKKSHALEISKLQDANALLEQIHQIETLMETKKTFQIVQMLFEIMTHIIELPLTKRETQREWDIVIDMIDTGKTPQEIHAHYGMLFEPDSEAHEKIIFKKLASLNK